MPIDEQEVRSLLAETAALAGPPRFSADDVAARVRRNRLRRRRRAGVLVALSVAALASAIAIPLTLGRASQSDISQSVISKPAPPAPRLSYTVTANGQTRAVPASGPRQLFTVTPGERLALTVEVTVPGPRAMTALWLGITNGVLSGHANMEPVLAASTRVPLRPGAHRFVLHWNVPAGLAPGTSRQLSVEWAWRGPGSGTAEGYVAYFAAPLPSAAESPAAVAQRLRSEALHAVAICDGARPAWIRAARTTFSKAMTVTGGGADLAVRPSDAVYVIVMKGEFAFSDGSTASSCADPTGRYFTTVVDAATFATLEAGVGNRRPAVPLRNLGPLLDLTRSP